MLTAKGFNKKARDECCLSLITKDRELDLEAASEEERDLLHASFILLPHLYRDTDSRKESFYYWLSTQNSRPVDYGLGILSLSLEKKRGRTKSKSNRSRSIEATSDYGGAVVEVGGGGSGGGSMSPQRPQRDGSRLLGAREAAREARLRSVNSETKQTEDELQVSGTPAMNPR